MTRRAKLWSSGRNNNVGLPPPFQEAILSPRPAVAQRIVFAYAKSMEVHFAPDVQAKIDQLVRETGRPADKLLEDALAGYALELVETHEMLDSRYDDLKSGRVKPIPGDEVIARLREKSAARRSKPGS
jgi:hypothetical protein